MSKQSISHALDHFMPMLAHLDRLKESINDALVYTNNTHVFDDVVHMVMNGRMRLIALENSFLLVEVLVYPQTKHLNVFLAGGDISEIAAEHEALIQHAKHLECSEMHMHGRAGWTKVMQPYGWTTGHHAMKYEVKSDG